MKASNLLMSLEEYADRIQSLNFQNLKNLSFENQNKVSERYLSSANIENIESGISGYLLFLLELYKVNNKDIYLKGIISITNDLIAHCRKTHTSNYSFYSGRGGFVYFLLKLYEVQRNENLIKDCIELIKPSGEDFFQSKYTSDYIYNGSSGTLLVLLQIFQITQDECILSLIERFGHRIMQNAILSPEGISWYSTGEINLKNSCGFAHGTAGVLYVLKNLNLCFPSPALEDCIKEAQRYISNSWDNSIQNWLNFEADIVNEKRYDQYVQDYLKGNNEMYLPTNTLCWNCGKAGVLLSFDEGDNNWTDFQVSLKNSSINIYEGISGIGLCILSSTKKNENILDLISESIFGKISFSLKGGLMHGELGAIYFLLKRYSHNQSSVLDPAFPNFSNQEIKLSKINVPEFNSLILKRYYLRTITYMEIYTPNLLRLLLQQLSIENLKSDFIGFHIFISNPKNFLNETQNYPVIFDIYELERKRYNFFKLNNRTRLQIYLDQIIYQKEILERVKGPAEWFLNQKLRISKSIQIVKSKWSWSTKEIYIQGSSAKRQSQGYEFILLHTYEDLGVFEVPLQLEGLILHRFNENNCTSQVIKEIKSFCQLQPPLVLNDFALRTGSFNIVEFMTRIDFLVTDAIKKFIYSRVLEFVPE